MSVPTIDLALRDEDIIADWRQAFSSVGFARLINHDLAASAERLAHLSRAFFRQTLDTKMKSSLNDRYGFGGYTPRGKENVGKTLVDASEEHHSDPVESLVFCGPQVPNLEQDLSDEIALYHRKASLVILRLMRLTAMSLDLSPDFFESSFESPSHSLRLAKYAQIESGSQDDDDKDEELLYGSHTDYTGFTLLLAQPLLGLQVNLPNAAPNEWTSVEDVPGALLVNSGDLIKRWTGDIFHSTLHRVRKVANNDSDRLSIVFFSGPNDDTMVEAINGKYPPIRAGDHLRDKLAKSNVE